jgi:osmotically-inducible protein OsmY
MVSDRTLQQDVLDELEFEPSVNAAHIGVTARDGVVTLSGFVVSFAEKFAAERAATRVKGVKAIAEEIEVRLPAEKRRSDDEIAKRALDFFNWDIAVPKDRIKIQVEKGVVTLSGEVDWQYQKTEAELDVRKLSGVVAVVNKVEVRPPVKPANIKEQILGALRRNAETEASGIKVEVAGSKVTLAGQVHGWRERNIAERAAWSAQGVAQVDDRITIV